MILSCINIRKVPREVRSPRFSTFSERPCKCITSLGSRGSAAYSIKTFVIFVLCLFLIVIQYFPFWFQGRICLLAVAD